MVERLVVENFAGIQELELDLNAINILIGPQAVGKSVCAKLLYYFKGFIHDLSSYAEDCPTQKEVSLSLVNKFEKYFPPRSWPKKGFCVRYELGNSFVELTRAGDLQYTPRLNYSEYYHKELSLLRKEVAGVSAPTTRELRIERWRVIMQARSAQLSRLTERFGYPSGFAQLFIPAGRSFFAHLQRGVFSFLQSDNVIDPFLTEFGSFYEEAKEQEYGRPIKDVDAIVEDILCGKYVRERDEDFVDHPDGRRIRLADSSSGQQEMLPLTVILRLLSTLSLRPGLGYSIYIEEPEGHLFPTAQRRMVELLSTVFNGSPNALQFIITTHSPYILTAFNNLMQAGLLAKGLSKAGIQRLERIVPATQRLDPDIVSAYSLEKGTGESIKCKDTNLINAEVIDRASDELSIQFGDLLDMDVENA